MSIRDDKIQYILVDNDSNPRRISFQFAGGGFTMSLDHEMTVSEFVGRLLEMAALVKLAATKKTYTPLRGEDEAATKKMAPLAEGETGTGAGAQAEA